MAPGKYTLRVSMVGYASSTKEVVVHKDYVSVVHFKLKVEGVAIDEVVVSANRNEVSRRDAPVVVSVASMKLFEAVNSPDLSKSLNYITGLRVENNCQNCGFPQVRINGLEGPYSQVLINSRPVVSALSGVYGLEQIPVNMIERVEVVRGGGSALFGANAVGGTVNIITKDPVSDSFSFNSNISCYDGSSWEQSVGANASLVSKDNSYGMALYASYRNRNPYDHDGDGFTELGKLNMNTFGMRAYFRPVHTGRLGLEYHTTNELRRGGNKFSLEPHESDITEQTKHVINSGGLSYDFSWNDYTSKLSLYASAQHIARNSYYGAQRDPNAYGKTDDLRNDQPFTNVHVDQLAMSSMRAEELRFLLDTTYPGDNYTDWRFYDVNGDGDDSEGNWFGKAETDINALRNIYINAIDNADVITYDLGINNFGVFMNRAMSGKVDLDFSKTNPELAEVYNEVKKQILSESGEMSEMLSEMEGMLDALAFTLVGFCTSFDATMAKIFELNPDVKVVVVGIQCLLTGMDMTVPGFDETLPLGELFEAVINMANTYTAVISPYAEKTLYADVSADGRVEFFVDQLLNYNGDPSTLDKDMIDCYNVYDDDLFASTQIEGLVNGFLAGLVKEGLADIIGYMPAIYGTSDEKPLLAAFLADGANNFAKAAEVVPGFEAALGGQAGVDAVLNTMRAAYNDYVEAKEFYMPLALAMGYDVITEFPVH